jgi:hypothetical protein
MHSFEQQLCISQEQLELELRFAPIAWSEFWLNPRRLRGSDFLMRWSQGVWSEQRLSEAVNQSSEYFALPYGPSGVAPSQDVRAFELYFERLEAAGLGRIKRPDLLILPKTVQAEIGEQINNLGGMSELPFSSEDHPILRHILSQTILAVECENSLWIAQQMPAYGQGLKPQKRLGGKPGLAKNAVLPTIIIKEEDRGPLLAWQQENQIPIHIWHVFYDLAFGLALDTLGQLLSDNLIQPTEQVFQAPSGATTKKNIYKVYYHYAYLLGKTITQPTLQAESITDKNGHILPFVRFGGGTLEFQQAALDMLNKLAKGEV